MSTLSFAYAPTAFRMLEGVLAVYKPAGLGINSLHNQIISKLLTDMNNLEQRPQKQRLLSKVQTANSTNQSLIPQTNVPDWSDHILVTGPRYRNEDFHISFGNLLDADACGVQVIGVKKKGEKQLKRLKYMKLSSTYRAFGQFGLTSMSHSPKTRILERSTWDHLSSDKINRVLMAMQGAHRNAMLRDSGLELSSHKAYELASKGLLRPMEGNEPVIVDLKLSSLNLPHFSLEVTCLNDTCGFIRKLVHEVAAELRSSAICTKLQRQRVSVFSHDNKHTLLSHQMNVNNFINSIHHYKEAFDSQLANKKKYLRKENLMDNCEVQFSN
uniref:mitochondrial mRNA pseudouridine synthase Trub2-like n=1 Tax=Ciona intestinalis TaxID=7719 RepID=UPI00006A5396|nr:mitochondrial mRNA pseudouridine synthase Trub2-like [Ciona intestinalis]XP_004226081.1 mitochondrial mRNA pseudouridine synthase Trub2-like [Ciona intestinalis]|eukprot:XP_002130921.1 mitochondrial mRNA pseudouridine synthase Trub2-like [Ciona intestinalis]